MEPAFVLKDFCLQTLGMTRLQLDYTRLQLDYTRLQLDYKPGPNPLSTSNVNWKKVVYHHRGVTTDLKLQKSVGRVIKSMRDPDKTSP